MTQEIPETRGDEAIRQLTVEDIARSDEFREYYEALAAQAEEAHGQMLDFILANNSWQFSSVSASEGRCPRAEVGLVTWLVDPSGSMSYVGLSHKWEIDDSYRPPASEGVAEWDESISPVPENAAEYVDTFMPPNYDAWEESYVLPEEADSKKAIELAMSVQYGTTSESGMAWLQNFIRLNAKHFEVCEISKELVAKLQVLAEGDVSIFEKDLNKIAKSSFHHADLMRWFGDAMPERDEYGRLLPTEQTLYGGETIDVEDIKGIRDGYLLKCYTEHVSLRHFDKSLPLKLNVNALAKRAAYLAMSERAGSSPLVRMVTGNPFGVFPKAVREASYLKYFEDLDAQRDKTPIVDDAAYDRMFARLIGEQVSAIRVLRTSLGAVASGRQVLLGRNGIQMKKTIPSR